MTIMRRKHPFKDLYQLRDDFNRLMVMPFAKMAEGYLEYPRVDVYQKENEIVLRAELPGVTKEDLDIRVARDSITIKGTIKQEQEISEENYLYRERGYGEFTRTIAIPGNVEYELAKASFQDGILELRVPKTEQDKGKKLQID